MVLAIEHHPDEIKTADYVIDLGPEGGEACGYLVAQVPASFTDQYLK